MLRARVGRQLDIAAVNVRLKLDRAARDQRDARRRGSARDDALLVTICGSSTAGMAGGATAVTGWNFAANGGLALGSPRCTPETARQCLTR